MAPVFALMVMLLAALHPAGEGTRPGPAPIATAQTEGGEAMPCCDPVDEPDCAMACPGCALAAPALGTTVTLRPAGRLTFDVAAWSGTGQSRAPPIAPPRRM